MEKTKLSVLLEGVGQAGFDADIDLVTYDSRLAAPGCVFVAVPGERTDGHRFVPEVLQKGAALAVVEHLAEGADPQKQLVVPSTLDAMIRMGGNYRALYSPIVAGVTGSVGKTTTKEFLAAVFSAFGKTLKNEGNKNNEYGVPLTLFQLDHSFEYAVIEMGMQALEDIRKLTLAARPAGAIITLIGVSHLGLLGSQENILKAKLEICDGLPDGAPLVLNGDDERLVNAPVPARLRKVFFAIENQNADVVGVPLSSGESGEHFRILDKHNGEFTVNIPSLGRHTIADALAAYTLVTRLGCAPAKAAAALAGYVPAGRRQRVVPYENATIIEDCYNASPDSMRAGLSTLRDFTHRGSKIAVLGDMLELGPQSDEMHTDIGQTVAQYGIDRLYTFGQNAAHIHEAAREGGVNAVHFDSRQDLVDELRSTLRPGDAVLFKASLGMDFAGLLQMFYGEEPSEADAH